MPNLLGGQRRSTSISATPSQKRLMHTEDKGDGIIRSSSNQKVTFRNQAQSPGGRHPSPSPNSSLNNTMVMNNSATSIGDNLTVRKNNYRQAQLKKIDSENLKIFQNLLRIKSSISKQTMQKHVKDNNGFRQMLQHYDQKIDPLISIEQRQRVKMQQRRQQSPFVGTGSGPIGKSNVSGTITRTATHDSIPGYNNDLGSLSKRGVGGGANYASAQTRFANNRASEIIRSAATGGPARSNIITSPKLSQTLPVNSSGNIRHAQIRTIQSTKPAQMTPRSKFLSGSQQNQRSFSRTKDGISAPHTPQYNTQAQRRL